jgi:hypothetical protein
MSYIKRCSATFHTGALKRAANNVSRRRTACALRVGGTRKRDHPKALNPAVVIRLGHGDGTTAMLRRRGPRDRVPCNQTSIVVSVAQYSVNCRLDKRFSLCGLCGLCVDRRLIAA